MTKVKQTRNDLETHLNEQLDFLMSSADRYDDGHESEAKRLAVTLRTLLHDTTNKDGSPRSQSLLGLLGMKTEIKFLDTSFEEGSLGSYTGLVMKLVGPNEGRFVAPLDDLPPDYITKKVSFGEFWDKTVFLDNNKNVFTRKDLVLAYANKDGGAHVDSDLEQDYIELTRDNSLGCLYGDGVDWKPLLNPVSAAIRQIAHEVIRSLKYDYSEKKLLHKNAGLVIGGMRINTEPAVNKSVDLLRIKKQFEKMEKNKKCTCGSGRKNRYCHGKGI